MPFLFLALVPIVGWIACRSWKQEQKRRELLLTWSASNGYDFTPRDDAWCARWSGSPFGLGDHRQARNVISGELRDDAFVAFDYSYETHSSDSKGHRTTTTHRYAVTSLRLPALLPRLQVTREGLFSRLGNALGLDDIELESEDFNRRFRVAAGDRKFATDVLTPRTMQALLALPDLSWRIDGSDIIAWDDGVLSPSRVVNTIGHLRTVVTGIPSFVWKDHA